MKFSDMETKMKRYEVNGNYASLPNMWLVIRADGRSESSAKGSASKKNIVNCETR